MGELMGYAGPGNAPGGVGLQPPKMALQFDTYPNKAAPNTYTSNICNSPSRNDPFYNTSDTGNADNVSIMFWGSRTLAGNPSCTYGTNSYPEWVFDANVHGEGGTSTDPQNNTGPGSAFYYQFPGPNLGYQCQSMPANKCGGNNQPSCLNPYGTCNWLEDGYTYSARMEIVRPSTISSDGTYHYQIKAWVFRPDLPVPGVTTTPLTSLQITHLQDVMVPFSNSEPAITPQINGTVKIYPTDHGHFNQIFFGFTEATGAANQQITVANFAAYFPQSTCSSPIPGISPTSANFGAAGGSNSVSVTPSSTCPWQATAVSTGNWITITSGSSGTSSGTVNYSVTANSGPARTGDIDIAGATFTIAQSLGCTALPSYTIFNETTTPIYPQRTDGSCHSHDSIPINGTYPPIAYNAAAVNFYPGQGSGNACTGTPISVNGPKAFAADANCDGNVQINSSWQLVDY